MEKSHKEPFRFKVVVKSYIPGIQKLESLESWEKLDLELDLEERSNLTMEITKFIFSVGKSIATLKKINTQSPNLILIVIDAARKDYFPTYAIPLRDYTEYF
jgi:hypothetical protein